MAFRTPLVRSDFKSDAWLHLAEHLELRVEELRTELESSVNTEQTSAAIRGRIGELRKILALARAPVDVPRAGDRYVGRVPVDTFTPPEGGI